MRRVKYVCCLMGLIFAGLACQDDETSVVPKPEGITYGTVADKAGNVYKTLTIGRQTWLAENFRYRLEDGDAADQVTYGESYESEQRVLLESSNTAEWRAYQTFAGQHYGQAFVLYLRQQLFAAADRGALTIDVVNVISGMMTRYTMPMLFSMDYYKNTYAEFKDELMRIWDDAVDYHFKVDKAYLEQFGYLYSYEGALRAAREGAPDGFHLPTDAEWMMLERALGMNSDELEGLENWRGAVGDLLKTGEQGIGFDALYGGAAVYALSTAYSSRYVNRGEGAYFWSSDEVFVSDSLSNGIVRNISCYHSGIRRMTSRLITSETSVRPSYSVRLVKVEK